MLDHTVIANECAAILRHQHPAWSASGDRIANAESFLWRIAHDMPDAAAALADDLAANLTDFSTETGLHPNRIQWMANRLRETIRLSAEPQPIAEHCPICDTANPADYERCMGCAARA